MNYRSPPLNENDKISYTEHLLLISNPWCFLLRSFPLMWQEQNPNKSNHITEQNSQLQKDKDFLKKI